MKNTNFIRKIDENGRFVLPMDIRKKLGIEVGDALKMYIEDDAVIIKKLTNTCVFCDNEDDIITFKDKNICMDCIKKLSISLM